MGDAHYFFVDDLGAFLAHLGERRYRCGHSGENAKKTICNSKTLSNALVKHYSYDAGEAGGAPVRIRVTYHLTFEGKHLASIAKKLKTLNAQYRQTLPGWKTKRSATEEMREKRWTKIQRFLHAHGELIGCFKYQADQWTEGSNSYNLEIASTPREQAICFEFIKALVDAYAPHRIKRARREPDQPCKRRNGWIKRYAELHRRKGWKPLEISKEIQRELQAGTWNQRLHLQYNLAYNTICRIAGMKLHAHSLAMN